MLSPELLDVAAIAIERKTGPVYDLSKDGLGMQCGRVVRASYWKSVGRGLKSCSPMGSSQLRLQYLTLSHIISMNVSHLLLQLTVAAARTILRSIMRLTLHFASYIEPTGQRKRIPKTVQTTSILVCMITTGMITFSGGTHQTFEWGVPPSQIPDQTLF